MYEILKLKTKYYYKLANSRIDKLCRVIYHNYNMSQINEQFSDLMSNICNMVLNQNKTVFLIGDLNIDVLKYGNDNFTSDYVNLLFSFGLIQVITNPTRLSNNSAKLIDHIIVSVEIDLLSDLRVFFDVLQEQLVVFL